MSVSEEWTDTGAKGMGQRYNIMKRKTQCACGKISGVVEGDPVTVLICHCDYCQRKTGSVFQVSCWYTQDKILELLGETKVYCNPNSLGVSYNFCPECGTTVYWTFKGYLSKYTAFSVGCFNDSNFPEPRFDIQRQYKHHWVHDIDVVKQFDSFPPVTFWKRNI